MNSKINKLITDPFKISESLSIKDLENIVEYANQRYYNSCKSVMDDDVYDIIRKVLERKNPDSIVLKTVGAPVENEKKVKLPYWMGSMDKIKPDSNQLRIFLNKFYGPFLISDKLDGSSGLFHRYKNTEYEGDEWINKLYTRGDGKYGKDISHLLYLILGKKFLENLPKKKFTVRGEIIISKKKFIRFQNEKKNPRALTNGIVNCKTINIQTAKSLDFVVFELLSPSEIKPSEQYKFIKSLGFKIPYFKIYNHIDSEILSDILLNRRKKSEYIIDGIIIQDNHSYPLNTYGNPESAIAFKMILKDQLVESFVLDVKWNISRHGILKPVVIYEPVILGGTKMQRATGFHAQFIKDNNIGPGSRILITRSGDVIPYIVNVITGTYPKFPDNINYHWKKHEIILDDKKDNKNIKIKKLDHFIKILDIKGIGIKNIELFVNNNIDTIKKLINSTYNDFIKLDRIADKSAINFFNAIQNAIIDVPLENIMAASQIFPQGLGKRKFKAILDVYPNILEMNLDKKETEDLISGIKGFDKTATEFAEGLPKFQIFLKKHDEIKIQKYIKNDDINSIFTNKNFVFTGIRDKNIEKYILDYGGKITNSVTKNTYLVIAKNPDSITGKVKKAKELNIKVISIDEFRNQAELP